MTPMRVRMIEDMRLAGLADGTQEVYVQALAGLAKHYRRRPEHLSEEEVRRYLLDRREQGTAGAASRFAITGSSFFTATRWAGTGLFLKKDPAAEAEATSASAVRRRGSPHPGQYPQSGPPRLLWPDLRLRPAHFGSPQPRSNRHRQRHGAGHRQGQQGTSRPAAAACLRRSAHPMAPTPQ